MMSNVGVESVGGGECWWRRVLLVTRDGALCSITCVSHSLTAASHTAV